MTGRWNGDIYRGDGDDELVEGRPRAGHINGAGGDDMLFGGLDDDWIYGEQGDDVMDGGRGDDRIRADLYDDGGADRAFGRDGDDFIHGGWGTDLLDGGSGDDRIWWDGDLAADTLRGGDGVDEIGLQANGRAVTYAVGDADVLMDGRSAIRTEGFERLYFYASFLDEGGPLSHDLAGGAFADLVSTWTGDDTILGLAGDDTLTVGSGADLLSGGAGDDVLSAAVDPVKVDVVSGGRGFDSLDYRAGGLAADQAVILERLSTRSFEFALEGGTTRVTSIEELSFFGGAGDDRLLGLGGDDSLGGALGADILKGWRGDDLLYTGVDDTLVGGEGHDTVAFGSTTEPVVLTLRGDRPAFAEIGGLRSGPIIGVENITGGFGADRLTGDAGDNVIATSDREGGGHDTLDGGAGIDTLKLNTMPRELEIALGSEDFVTVRDRWGLAVTYRNFENVVGTKGSDTITGDDDANRIEGWHGNDRLTGGAGADVFVYAEFLRLEGENDVITDFSHADGDRIDLTRLDIGTSREGAVELSFVGEAAFSGAAGEIRFADGATSQLQIDFNGDRKVDFSIALSNGAEIGAGDLIL